MNLGLSNISRQAIGLLFGITDLVKGISFVRPAGFNPTTGVFTASETVVAANMVVLGSRPIDFSDPATRLTHDRVVIRGAELASITAPGPGDYLVESASGHRRDMLAAALYDLGNFWVFATLKSIHEDWGGLAAATLTEDRGDLATATVLEDFGTLTA